ncbi:MAG: hypothetical protein KC983_09475 [Phycisphaerales bacterium]|nr:hypothetical protein [Phycisphaerales bacterium]
MLGTGIMNVTQLGQVVSVVLMCGMTAQAVVAGSGGTEMQHLDFNAPMS